MSDVIEGKQVTSSSLATTSGKSAKLFCYEIQHGTATQSSVTFRDGTATGTIKWVNSRAAQTVVGDVCDKMRFPQGMAFQSGIYCVLAGTNTKLCIGYTEEA